MLKDAREQKPIMGMDGKLTTQTECQELEFDSGMLPEIKGWQVGEEYDLVVRVKMIGVELDEDAEHPEQTGELEAEFHVLAVEARKEPQSQAEKIARTKLGLN